jgi:hypothetical protein
LGFPTGWLSTTNQWPIQAEGTSSTWWPQTSQRRQG